MHTEKYNSKSVNAMVHHYARDLEGTLKRENIDETKTYQNYEIGEIENKNIQTKINKLKQRIENETGRKVRKDAVLLSDIVLTLPSNVPESDEKRFFELSANKLNKMLTERGLSSSAIVVGYVHKDEARPHMHFAFTPVKENTKGNLTFSFKTIVKREFYRNYHEELQNYLTEELGYKPNLLREDEDKLKSLSKLDQDEYKKVKDKMRKDEEEHEQKIKEINEVLDEKKVSLSQLKATLNKQKKKLKLQKLNPLQNKHLKELEKYEKELKNWELLSKTDITTLYQKISELEEF